MLGDTSLARVPPLQQPSRMRVGVGAVGRGDLPVDSRAQDRVGECEWPLIEHAGAIEELGRIRRRARRRSARAAASAGSARSSTDTARASRVASGPSRRSCSTAQRPTVVVASPRTLGAEAATGATPSWTSAATSMRTRKGVPPVASRQADTNPGSGSAPNPSATSRATASVESSAGQDLGHGVHRQHREQLPLAGSRLRGPHRDHDHRAQLLEVRGSRKARTRSDAQSAHCASSSTRATGRTAARFATSQ